MFEPSATPRVFAQAPGVDFPRAVIDGLRARLADQPPDAMARVTLFVNTTRMKRRIADLFDDGPPALLPRIRLVTDLGHDAAMADLSPAVSPLRRRLELASLISDLLESQPDLAPRHAIYALADSLAALMDEMQGEGVGPKALQDLDVDRHSAYWARSLAFVSLVEKFFGAGSSEPPDLEARQRRVIERITATWQVSPPSDPIIIAGSTGSRGATAMLMETVARLPQGAVILPGYDFDMPAKAWSGMDDQMVAEDHPQYRFHRLLSALALGPEDVRHWHSINAPAPRRNALISLALRPAPVTDQWQAEGPGFTDVGEATAHLSLIEAPTPREEAAAISVVLRDAAERGLSAALITPDRVLTRQVTAALDRWDIRPDDSAGQPLPLTAPGRLLRHVAELRGRKVTGVDLLTVLKHPLTHRGADRNEHLRLARELELTGLRRGMPFPDLVTLASWADKNKRDAAWAEWAGRWIADVGDAHTAPLADHVAATIGLTERLVAGAKDGPPDELWAREAGREARRVVGELEREAEHGGEMSASDFRDLFSAVLNTGSVRNPDAPYPGIRIWGTLEARVGGAELVILAGLNEGVWPERPSPDPWMNRDMRKELGLLLPERRIGLSAHDFQQGIGAPEVILSRSLRDEEAETVPSRWINRMTNLMSGMSEAGAEALAAMKDRGAAWLSVARELDRPQRDRHRVAPAPRPSPRPPVEVRPTALSFTRISTLIRDPYAIYGQKILRLHALDPLHQSPDAPLRGTAIHDVMERFIKERPKTEARADARRRLMSIAREEFETTAPWPATRLLWLAKLERVADWFLEGEDERQKQVTHIHTEVAGKATFGSPPFTLYGKADRIDLRDDGQVAIYDYKTGAPPSEKQQRAYDKQLLLEALVARAGGFDGLGKLATARVAYIGLGATPKVVPIDVTSADLERVQAELETILAYFQDRDRGYTSRRVVESSARFGGDYDHLARYGEWDHTADPEGTEVGE
ncbi:double-strand break repair protein AddB [Maritimibacter sp. UBA3975]|uniref:double-strand break repair protein AddB n=1 Tax=Maritimibacter sp. UBA3975 TaxID=1946833 RepID=UPI000C0BB8CB|nr:double-strand break repair protein AddB [Maritimibacter sp. UBA3975]MAM63409.1 double-strand break repair protein AddB [Maritimibacter sp.]